MNRNHNSKYSESSIKGIIRLLTIAITTLNTPTHESSIKGITRLSRIAITALNTQILCPPETQTIDQRHQLAYYKSQLQL